MSGSKAERIERVIEYFDKLVFRDAPDEAPPGQLYFQYLVELARRDREILLANDVIRKDREMDDAFEAGTRESVYTFPASHLRQFKRYIRDSEPRVACSLIIVPEVDDQAAHRAARLKVESGTDTDVALITAEDLVWVTEAWQDAGSDRTFDPEIFNITGILGRLLHHVHIVYDGRSYRLRELDGLLHRARPPHPRGTEEKPKPTERRVRKTGCLPTA